ncbi:MAG TPA: hypothetical protein PKU82_07040 [Bacteroidia bacterium]|nr:hypothetical protein [Bacteroidia bacterium]
MDVMQEQFSDNIENIDDVFKSYGLQSETIELVFVQSLLKNIKPDLQFGMCDKLAERICIDTMLHKISQFNMAMEKEHDLLIKQKQ